MIIEEFPEGFAIAVLKKEVVIIGRLKSTKIPNDIRMF
jgi:hypothetical protein